MAKFTWPDVPSFSIIGELHNNFSCNFLLISKSSLPDPKKFKASWKTVFLWGVIGQIKKYKQMQEFALITMH